MKRSGGILGERAWIALSVACLTAGALAQTQPGTPPLTEPPAPALIQNKPADHDPRTFVWPDRFGQRERGSPGVIIPAAKPYTRAWMFNEDIAMRADAAHARELLLKGVTDDPGDESLLAFSLDGYLLFRELGDKDRPAAAYATGPMEWFKFVSARTVPPPNKGPAQFVLDQTYFALYSPSKGSEPRAIALVLPGMLGTPEPIVEGLITRLRGKGFAVLRCLTHPARYCSHAEIPVDFKAPQEGLRLVAAELDDRVAEYAYAVQAAWKHVESRHPAWAKLPQAVIGLSGGAIALPTIVALEPDRYGAAVLVAGGANGLAIADRSNYANQLDALRVQWQGLPTRAQKAEVYKQYLEFSSLDTYHTAPILKKKPVLVFHATNDLAVPSDLGDQLWERLGKPERWSFPATHEGIFVIQMAQNGKIVDWILKALQLDGQATSTTPQPKDASAAPTDNAPR